MRKSITVATAMMMGTLARDIEELETKLDQAKNYMNAANKNYNELLTTLDAVIGQMSDDVHADVVEIHSELMTNWPVLPYFMRKDY